jgi:CRISPR/Cas system-associated protein Cas5 (RAMP superfamily)
MTVLIWIIIGLLVIIGALSYACFNLIKKIEIYEDWVNRFKSESDSLYQRLKIVDYKNLFEKDDDVGFVFSEVLRITKEFNETVK